MNEFALVFLHDFPSWKPQYSWHELWGLHVREVDLLPISGIPFESSKLQDVQTQGREERSKHLSVSSGLEHFWNCSSFQWKLLSGHLCRLRTKWKQHYSQDLWQKLGTTLWVSFLSLQYCCYISFWSNVLFECIVLSIDWTVCWFPAFFSDYFGVDESGVISLHVMMMGSFDRKFDMTITQIPCQSGKRAPLHCLQYLTGTHGKIKSFNYDSYSSIPLSSNANNNNLATTPSPQSLVNVGDGYPNDIDYIICLKKEPGFCSVTYELATQDTRVLPFGIGTVGPVKTLQGRQVHPLAQCNEDFLTIGGVRLCSSSIPSYPEGQSYVSDIAYHSGIAKTDIATGVVLNATVASPTLLTDSTPGPFLARFVSNKSFNSKGFYLFFRQNPCH